ncbi:MAG: hypothetical protein ABJB76_02145 [Candidatus Nitrosocosmicus sp.]
MSSLLVSRKEKEKLVLKLAAEGKTTREIAKIVHISLKDIGKIIRKATGDYEELQKEEKEKEKQKQLKSLSVYAKAFQMFKDKKSLAEVVIELDVEARVVLSFYNDYLNLARMNHLVGIYQDLKDDFSLFFHLYKRIKKEGLTKQEITALLENQNKLSELEERVTFYNEHIQGQITQKTILEKEINGLRTKRDNYDGISSL